MNRNICVRCILSLVVALSASAPMLAWSQSYPTKPMRIILPVPPGGAIDQIVQQIGPKLTQAWGQQVLMDHRAGATQIIGTQLAARAAPDGYTLFMCNSAPFSGNVALYPSVPYDPVKDFAAITVAVTYPNVLVVHPSVAANSVQELIALAKARPGQLNFASAGPGSSSHISGELFNLMAGVKMIHVPYKGNSLAVTDLVGGQVQAMFSNVGPVLPHIKSGRLKALGVTSAQRFGTAPDIPTIAESGLPGFEIIAWVGFCAPAATPRDIIAKLNTEIVRALRSPDVQKALRDAGAETAPMTTEQMDAFIKTDMAKWARVVKDANIKLD
ncbi:MAG: tripartite tricarboxylate transporter substrate binding protein [Burkholderiaceae bacterium]|nr:tripartite tricarboxylate transporter substrate binding protein [Burkholderiaceae bacterium]